MKNIEFSVLKYKFKKLVMGKIKLKNMREKHKKNSKRYWSDKITKHSNALDLEKGVFTFKNPRKIALSLKKSSEASTRRKAGEFQSAMSMLNFYINRAGKNLPKNQRKILEQAKIELRKIFNRKSII